MPAVDFYFDCSCPWTYLAFTRLKETATRTGATVNYKPILVDRVQSALNPGYEPSRREPVEAKENYGRKDLQDWARYCSIVIRIPDAWPADLSAAMAGAIYAARQQRAAAYLDAVFAAYFDSHLAIDDPEMLAGLAADAGCDSDDFRRSLGDAALLAEVHANGDELISRGGFGSPSMFVGDDLYFGNDRMPLVEFAIGQSSQRTFVMPGQHGP